MCTYATTAPDTDTSAGGRYATSDGIVGRGEPRGGWGGEEGRVGTNERATGLAAPIRASNYDALFSCPPPTPSCLMTLDESRFERAAGAKVDVTGHTLILPCVSIGSVPQLAIDALLEPSNSTAIFGRPGQLISTLDHRFCVPFVGGLQRGYASSASADERIQGPLRVYAFEEAKVTIVQQRSPIVKVRVVARFLHLPLAPCTLTPGHSHSLARKTLYSSSLLGSHKGASPTS